MQSAAASGPSTTMQQAPSSQLPPTGYDTQYYYTAPVGSQQPPPQQQYGAPPQPQYYQDGGYMTSAPMPPPPPPHGQYYQYAAPQPIIYYQHQPQAPPMYYPMAAPQPAPMMAQVPQQGDVIQAPQQHIPQPPPHLNNELSNQRGPLTSSTPLPSRMEYENAQREMAARQKTLQFRYYRQMEHDDEYDHMLPIDEISKITIDHANEDTMSAEKENLAMDQRSDKTSRRNPFGGESQQTPTQQPVNYKTRLCMMHAAGTRPCEMGSRCKFAHGLKELRTAETPARFPNNKYKTKLCKNFARGGTGFCPYGLRCEFVHPTDKEFQSIPIYQRMLVDDRVLDADMSSELEDYPPSSHHHASHHNHHQQHMQSTKRYLQQMALSTRRGGAVQPSKTLLKHRNVVGSMMCLSQTGRGMANESNSMAGGDFNSKPNGSFDHLPPHLRRASSKVPMNSQLTKQSRRQSLSQLKTRWTSEEHLSGGSSSRH